MTTRRMKRNRPGERGTIYVATLGTATLVTVIAMSGLALARLERRTATIASQSGVVRDAARSGLEIALQIVNEQSGWRGSSTVYSGTIDGCEIVVTAGDLSDSDLADGACETVTLVSRASKGRATERLAIRLDPASDEPYSPVIDGLFPVGYWPLRNVAGVTAPDVRQVSDGLVVGGVVTNGGQCDACYDAPVFGTPGGYIEIPHDDTFLLDSGSIAFWFYADAPGSDQGLLSKADRDAGDGELLVYLSDAEVRVGYATAAGSGELRSGELEHGIWRHVTVTFGGNGGALYIDGSLAQDDPTYIGGLGAHINDTGNQNPIVLGGRTSGSTPGSADQVRDTFTGRIRDVALFAYELSESQIAELAADKPQQQWLTPTARERARVVD